MDKQIIILANSWKHGGRCVAGVEVEETKDNFQIICESYQRPYWIRPISRTDNGELSLSLVQSIEMLSIVSLINAQSKPMGYQSENFTFDELKIIGNISQNEQNLDLLLDKSHATIFGNSGKAVHQDHINSLDYSLMLIKPTCFSGVRTTNARGNCQFRGNFQYNNVIYDLPITDPTYKIGCENNKMIYLSLSLGTLFSGYHYKLIAGVIAV